MDIKHNMGIKKILKMIIIITVVLSSVFQVQPAFATEVPDIPYDVMFDLHGGSGFFPSQAVNHGDFVEMPLENPIRAGHDFIGWFTDIYGDELFDFSVPITEDVVIHARWSARSVSPGFFMVNFELNGGVFTLDFDSQIIPFFGIVTRPATDPIREGYIFVGWFMTNGVEFDFNMPILINSTPHAHWEPILHTVAFELNGSSDSFPNQTINHGNFAEIPLYEPTRVGYIFIGWFIDASMPFDFSTPITEDIVIYAQWALEIGLSGFVIVHFELNGGMVTSDFKLQIVQFATKVTRPATNPVREGYIFTGWSTSVFDGSEFNFDSPLNVSVSNMTLYAQWQSITALSHVVSFELNGGNITSDFSAQIVPYSGIVARPTTDPIRHGYIFTGWFTSAIGGQAFNFTYPITGEIVIHAQWQPIAVVLHVVSFELNGGMITSDFDSQIVPYSGIVARPATDPIRHGYIFTGWFTLATGGDEFNFDVPVTQNTVLYALWKTDSNNDSGAADEESGDFSGVVMKVDDDGTIIITGPQLGNEAIRIFGALAPFDAEIGGVGEFGEIFIVFPGCTEPDELDVVTPNEWTYDYYHDVPGNLVLALLPPGIDLATALSNPSAPQPRDRSIIDGLEPGDSEQTEDDDSEQTEDDDSEQTEDDDSEQTVDDAQRGLPENESQNPSFTEQGPSVGTSPLMQYASLTQHASLPNSLVLFGGMVLKSRKELKET